MKAQPDYSIYLVTDDGCLQGRALLDCVREALEGGVTLVQYRAKTAASAEMYAEALQLKALCNSFNVPLIINDRLDIAMAVGAAGVHLGQDDLPALRRASFWARIISSVFRRTIRRRLKQRCKAVPITLAAALSSALLPRRTSKSWVRTDWRRFARPKDCLLSASAA